MRKCQICNHDGKRVIENTYHYQEGFCLFECTKCGHRYVDGLHLSQAWFDEYYTTKYTTDDKPYSDARLASLADCVVVTYKRKTPLDIGGMDGELVKRMNERGALSQAAGIDTKNGAGHDAVILSHTLEHIYDVSAIFQRVTDSMRKDGYLFIEVPIHLEYNDPKAYDYHYQHINKFRPIDLERLCTRKGFEIVESKQIADYREYKVWRLVGRRG